MSTWGNADSLLEMLQRQLQFFGAQGTERRLLLLGRWLGFLRREPQLAGLVAELFGETKRALQGLTRADHEVRARLGALWTTHGALIRAFLADEMANDELHVYGHIDRFSENVAERPAVLLPRWQLFDEDTTETETLVLALKHWASWAISLAERTGEPADAALIELRDRITEAGLELQQLKRRLRLVTTSLAGPALYRLEHTVREATPTPPKRDENADEGTADEHDWAVAIFERSNEFAEKVHSRRGRDMRLLEGDEVSAVATTIGQDVELITHELQMRLLAGRSRLVLVQRYAAQCEGFDAKELRERVHAAPGTVEQQLTLNFAKYLFQQGLTPILDGTVANLRPDVLHAARGGLLYVEAKQYGDDVSRGKIIAAYRQVWSTWGRLANVHHVPEAFLLVFRVGGPRAELPPVLRHSGRSLYSVLVDVSEMAGSREKATPLSFTANELVPAEADATT